MNETPRKTAAERSLKLFAYFATADDGAMRRLRGSIAKQQTLDAFAGHEVFKLLTVGSPDFEITKDLREYFDEIILMDCYHVDRHGIKRLNYCALRNPTLSFAERIKAKWLYFCDIDTVYVKVKEPLEENTFNIARVYWQKNSSESLSWSVDHIKNWGDAIFSPANSWFIIHHSLFTKYSFNENIWGYTFDDTDYSVRVSAREGGPHRVEAHVVHVFHDNSLRNLEIVSYCRNQSIFNASLHMSKSNAHSDLRDFETFYDAEFNEAVIFNWESKTAFSSIDDGPGRIVMLGDMVVIEWPLRWALYKVVKKISLENLISRLASSLSNTRTTSKSRATMNSGASRTAVDIDFNNRVIACAENQEIGHFTMDGNLMHVTWRGLEKETFSLDSIALEKA